MSASWLGDSRSGKFADNLIAFGRALRRAGVPVDSSRLILATQALALVQPLNKGDVAAALEAVFISREQDRAVFAELFEAFFRNPEVAQKLLAQMLPAAEGKAEPVKRRPRVREALAPPKALQAPKPSGPEQTVKFDAAMTATTAQRLRHADFNQLSSAEYALVERLAREVSLPVPLYATRRTRLGVRGSAVAWPRVVREAARTGGEPMRLVRRARVLTELPLLVLVDVSGSMERYARLLLAFLHAATRGLRRRDVFAFGNQLTPLNAAFATPDTDTMLDHASAAITDFASGTQLSRSLAQLREQHARRLVGRRSLVLLISDGLDTGDPAELGKELEWLKRHCLRLVWLNPLLRFDGYQPLAQSANLLHQRSDAMLAVHNLASLHELAASLAKLIRH